MGNQCFDPTLKQKGSDFQLCIKVETWNKQAHNLFDHCSDKLKKQQNLLITSSALLVKYDNGLRVVDSLNEYRSLQTDRMDFMVDIIRAENQYRLLRQPLKDNGLSQRNLWRVVGKHRVEIECGDIIKLGRLRFHVAELVVNIQHPNINPLEQQQEQFASGCKICYEKNFTKENPLISPCACTGSIQYIHLFCLRQWLEKLSDVKRTESSLSIPYTLHNCQLCNQNIKQQITVNGVKHNTYHKPIKMQLPYVKLVLFGKDSNKIKGVYYYSFNEKPNTFMGRSSSAGIRIVDDISISRQHSQLLFEQGRLYLSDFKSKFGTLVLIRSPVRLTDSAFSLVDMAVNRTVQICNHVLTVQVRPVNRKPNHEQLKKRQSQMQMILSESRKDVIQDQSVVSAGQSIVQFEDDD